MNCLFVLEDDGSLLIHLPIDGMIEGPLVHRVMQQRNNPSLMQLKRLAVEAQLGFVFTEGD